MDVVAGGGVFPSASARGRPCMNATGCGPPTGRGNVCCIKSRPPPTSRVRSTGTSRWTPPSCGPISTRPVPGPTRRRPPRQRGPKRQNTRPSTVAKPARPAGGGGAGGEGLGRSRGGFTSKLHLSADGRCRPLSLVVAGGQRADCTQFQTVLAKVRVCGSVRDGPTRSPTASRPTRATATARAASTCGAEASGTRSRRRPTARLPACAKAHAADGHPASTKSGTRSATPSNERSTG